MFLYDKIVKLYPELSDWDFVGPNKTIFLQNDSDGRGDYIAKWDHPTLQRPTQEQLDEIN